MLKQQSLSTLLACTTMPSGPTNGSLTCSTQTAGGSTITCQAELLKNQNSTPTCVRTSPQESGITGCAPGIADLSIICGQLLNAPSNGWCLCAVTMAPFCGPKKNMRAPGITHCSLVHQVFGTHSPAPSILLNSSMNQNPIGLLPPINCVPRSPLDPMLSNPRLVGRWTGTTQFSPTRWKAIKPKLVWPTCGTPLQWRVAESVASVTNLG